MNSKWKGSILVLISAISFGLMPVFARFAYSKGVDVPELLFVRFSLAFLFMGFFLKISGKNSIPPKRYLLVLLALGGFGYFLQSILYFTALFYIPVSLAALVLYTYPAFVMAGSLILRLEKISFSIVFSLMLTIIGLFLVANPILNVASLGILIGLGAAITYTIYILVSTKVLNGVSGELGSFYVMGAASLSFFVSNLFTNNFNFGWTLEAWIWVLLITVICTFIAIATFFQGIKKIGPSRSSILSSIELVTSVLVASLVFNDILNFTQLVGGVLIFLATIIIGLKK